MNIDKVTPQNDVLFKIIFADVKHKNVLMHFLNSAVESDDKITDVKILNSEIIPEHVSEKSSRLDVLAKTNSGNLIDIEIQVNRDHNMIGRTLFYWAKLFIGQLEIGQRYSQLRRTITINILNFELFREDTRFWRKCFIVDRDTNKKITDLLEIQFVELNKMRKFDKKSPITFWIEFFKDPYSDTCKELYKLVPELNEAKNMMEKAKADPKKRQLIEERENAARDYASAIADAKIEGIEKGKAEERAKADKELAEERAKAYAGKIDTAKNLIKIGLSIEQISQATGLSIDEISHLAQ